MSALTVSFFIGAIPSAIVGAWSVSANRNTWEMTQSAIVSGAIMGLFGSSAGLTFWVLWRNWASRLWPDEQSSTSLQDS
jgi:hypothetical protein